METVANACKQQNTTAACRSHHIVITSRNIPKFFFFVHSSHQANLLNYFASLNKQNGGIANYTYMPTSMHYLSILQSDYWLRQHVRKKNSCNHNLYSKPIHISSALIFSNYYELFMNYSVTTAKLIGKGMQLWEECDSGCASGSWEFIYFFILNKY